VVAVVVVVQPQLQTTFFVQIQVWQGELEQQVVLAAVLLHLGMHITGEPQVLEVK
jgi:hypothetical protein